MALLGLIPLAISLGAAAVGNGLSVLEALAMSVFVLSGAAQMAMIELISSGASAAVIVLTALVISLRLTVIALIVPVIKDRATVTAALSASVAAVFAATLPLNLGLITAALVGVLAGLLERALRFVPAAALTALVIPFLFYENGALQVFLGNERLLAGLVAALVAWRTRSDLFTLGAGMATLWTLQAVGQSL